MFKTFCLEMSGADNRVLWQFVLPTNGMHQLSLPLEVIWPVNSME